MANCECHNQMVTGITRTAEFLGSRSPFYGKASKTIAAVIPGLDGMKMDEIWKLYGDGSKPWYLVNPKIAGKWMFIPLKMYL